MNKLNPAPYMCSLEFAKVWHHVYRSALDTPDTDETEMHANVDPQAIADPDACKLGRWMRIMPERIKKMPTFERLEAAHNQFHLLAGAMTQALHVGDKVQAKYILEGELTAASHAIDQALDELASELPLRQKGS